jgi:Lrp/AsnC family leucine-responsive transcriptional regulator
MYKERIMDEIDLAILSMLQDDARTSNAEIARRVGMAPSAVFERIRKLEERGVIQGYTARIDPQALGLGLLAFVFVRSEEGLGAPETERALAALPEVQELHHVAGEDCFLVKVRLADTAALGRLLRDGVGAIKTVRSTRSTIVLETVKETNHLPLTGGAPEDAVEGAEVVDA